MTKTAWTTRDLLCLILLSAAAFALLNAASGGITKFIADTDKPSPVYGDFCEYYYPAGRMITKHPQPLGGYFYTPIFALALTFFTPDSAADAITRWQILQHCSIFLLFIVPGMYLAAKTGKKIWFFLYALVFLLSFPLWHNLKWGQMSVLITFSAIFSLLLYERGHRWSAAFLLASGSLIKYYPGTLIFYFLIRKDFAFIARFTALMLIMGLILPGFVLGTSETIEFYRLLHEELDHALDWVAFDLNSQFLPHVVIRLFGLEAEAATRGILSLISLGVCLLLFFKLYQLHSDNQQDFMLAASGIFLLFPLLINTSWPHYFVYLPFCGLLLLQNAKTSFIRAIIAIALIMQSCLIYALSDYQFYAGNGFLLVANLLLLGAWFRIQKKTPGSGRI